MEYFSERNNTDLFSCLYSCAPSLISQSTTLNICAVAGDGPLL